MVLFAPWASIRAGYYLVDASSDAIPISLQAGRAHIVHISTHGGETDIEVESTLGYASTLSADALSKALQYDPPSTPPAGLHEFLPVRQLVRAGGTLADGRPGRGRGAVGHRNARASF